jgi:hypothetical protein
MLPHSGEQTVNPENDNPDNPEQQQSPPQVALPMVVCPPGHELFLFPEGEMGNLLRLLRYARNPLVAAQGVEEMATIIQSERRKLLEQALNILESKNWAQNI